MSEQSRLIDVRVIGAPKTAYAGDWVALTLALNRPADAGSSVQIRNVSTMDTEIQLDTDLLQTDVEIRPGEEYRLTLPLRVAHPRTLALEKVNVQVVDALRNELVDLPPQRLDIVPGIAQEIAVHLEPLCSYDQGTKIQLKITHRGASHFSDLVITLGPESAIRAGKRVVRRASFKPGDPDEQFEAVVDVPELIIEMAAQVNGLTTRASMRMPVGRVPGRSERSLFRFLQPRRLSLDQKAVYEIDGTDQRQIEPSYAAYPMRGERRYLIVITPADSAVTDVRLREMAGTVHVRNAENSADGRSWKFLVDVSFTDLLRRPERLFYDVRRGDESLTGELHICLCPPRGRRLRLAAALGVAVTAQGMGALARFLIKSDYSFEEAFSHFQLASDYQLLFLLSIPVFWAALRAYDWLQYRLTVS